MMQVVLYAVACSVLVVVEATDQIVGFPVDDVNSVNRHWGKMPISLWKVVSSGI
jgi:hypothetical protein